MSYLEHLRRTNIQIFILVAVTLICFFNISFNHYAFDDPYLTENKYVLKGIDGLYDIWTHAFIEVGGMQIDYRPITLTFYSLEHMVFGNNPMVSHIISILLYIINILLLFYLSKKVFELDKIHTLVPFLIVLLFSVHPSHTEVVASLKNRDEIMNFIFMLVAVIFFNNSFRQTIKHKILLSVVITFIFFYLSMLTKLVSLPFMACMFLFTLYNKDYKNYKIFFSLLIGFGLITLFHMYSISEYLNRNSNYYENPLTNDTALPMRLGLAFNTLFYYIKFLLIPFPFRFYYGYNVIPFESINNPIPLLSLLIYGFLAGLLIYSIAKKKSYSYFLCSFLFLVFFYSNIIVAYTGIVSERSMYQLSYFFIAFIIVFFYSAFISRKNIQKKTSNNNFSIPILIYLLFILIFSFLTIKRNAQWKDVYTLILSDKEYIKESALGNYQAGINCSDKSISLIKDNSYESRKWAEEAISFYNRAIILSPDRKILYYKLGNTYRYSLSDYKRAEEYYLQAERIDTTTIFRMARNIGSLYFIKAEYSKAIPYYAKAVQEEPEDAELLFYQALNLCNAKNFEQFLIFNERLLKKFPETQYPYLNYGTYYYSKNEPDKVIENFEIAVKFGCTSRQVLDHLIEHWKNNNNIEKVNYYSQLRMKI